MVGTEALEVVVAEVVVVVVVEVVVVAAVVAVVVSGSKGFDPVVFGFVETVVECTIFGAVMDAFVEPMCAVDNGDVVVVEVAAAEAKEVLREELEAVIKVPSVAFAGMIACAAVALERTPAVVSLSSFVFV